MSTAYIYDAIRTPRGKGKESGALYPVRPMDLLSGVLSKLSEKNDLDTSHVEDVVIGCVTQTGEQGTQDSHRRGVPRIGARAETDDSGKPATFSALDF